MSKEICISSTPHETRLAILEDEQLTEVYYERENEYTLAGSIYKGRVTRVLPGMQSAFVDVGLERDAFLYVTDFMEEQEDSSDFERVPAGGRNEGGEAGQEPRQNRDNQPRRDQRPPRAPQPAVAAEEHPKGNGAASEGQSPAGEFEDGTRKWRGRRGRRRGGRPVQGGGQQGGQQQQAARTESPRPVAPPVVGADEDADVPTPFALPGESLSKYGGQSAVEKAPGKPVAPPPPTNAILSKPSTLVEVPLNWDGAGPLPGESLSRYRGGADAPVHESPVHEGSVHESHEAEEPVAASEEPVVTHEPIEPQPIEVQEHEPLVTQEEELEAAPVMAVIEVPEEAPVAAPEEIVAAVVEFEPEEASASYRIDPAAPSEFRFASPSVFEEEVTPEAAPAEIEAPAEEHVESHPHHVDAAASTGIAELDEDFDEEIDDEEDGDVTGTGLVEEEEVAEEEDYDFSPLYVESEEHDLEELEEETLDHEVAAGGAISEMVRDAHMDQRIEGDASGVAIEDGSEEDELEDPQGLDEAEVEEGQVAVAAPGQPARRPRDDSRRGGRGGRNDGRRRQGGGGRRQNAQTSDLPIISELLKQGQEILVQIAKEPIAKKGARITSHIALPGRFLVFMPTVNHVGVSRKISSDEERLRLKRILISEKGTASGGFIVRTAADGASEDDLRADIRFLISLWAEIKQRSDTAKAPALIYHDLNLVERILRDQVSDNFSTIWVDTEAEYERIVRFLERFQPSLVRRVKLYTKETPLFEQFGIQEEITKALKSKVWLKSGGSIVINQTEALVAIDINTGKYVGKTARLEDTILKTNLDAIPEIVRQIRLRDLGGIIVIDFIDMDERKNRNKVMQALEDELKSDRAPSKVLQFNDFGLVAITRKRVKQSLERTLSIQCSICAGTGMVKSPTTVCNEIYIEMRKMQLHLERQDVLLRVHPEVVKTLKLTNARWLNELEEMSGKTIIVKSDPTLHPEQFDIH
jgi:Rne/Rng family ribonuclease